jgi:hypothetical protein
MHCQKFIYSTAILDNKVHAPRTLTSYTHCVGVTTDLYVRPPSFEISRLFEYTEGNNLEKQRWLAGLCRTTVVNTSVLVDREQGRKEISFLPRLSSLNIPFINRLSWLSLDGAITGFDGG